MVVVTKSILKFTIICEIVTKMCVFAVKIVKKFLVEI